MRKEFQDFLKQRHAGNYVWRDVGDGWTRIVDGLFFAATRLGSKVLQVKQKFGGLRFYVDKESKELSKIIREAELEADKTCEECGSKEDVKKHSPKGWIFTLCRKCRENS